MLLTNIWLILNMLFYYGLGIFTLIQHSNIAKHLSYNLMTPAAIAEFKSAYGGLPIAIAIYLTYLFVSNDKRAALLFITIIYVGYGLGRMVGIIFNQAHDNLTIMYSCIEIVSILIGILLLKYAK